MDIKDFDTMLSLGANCYPKIYMDKALGLKKETELFDYIGCSMWSINACLKDDFKGLFFPEKFTMMPIIKDSPPMVTNRHYYLRFMHYLKSASDAKDPRFIGQLNRRIERFENYMRNSENILCIRLEENQKNRIQYYKSNERDELDGFISIVKEKYGTKNIKIIWLNTKEDGWNKDKTILSVKIETLDFSIGASHTIIEKCLARYLDKSHIVE